MEIYLSDSGKEERSTAIKLKEFSTRLSTQIFKMTEIRIFSKLITFLDSNCFMALRTG